MSSTATKNGHGDQNDQSVSTSSSNSSSSSAATSATKADGEKKNGGVGRTLKSLLKKKIDPNQDFIKSHNKRVKFSETMQVFCYELPDNQMPQIIALKSPAEMSLMEFQSYMFEPPAEYQDFLAFEPPPDYRDLIANSLNVFRNEVTFDYIDDDDDDGDSECAKDTRETPAKDKSANKHHISSVVITNEHGSNSKWKSMILDNNLDSLEEEQIIGVLKEDEILQAIGSQISLPDSAQSAPPPVNGDLDDSKAYTFEVVDSQGGHHHQYEENLSSEDFPVHHLNSYMLDPGRDDDDDEPCCVDSSPNGSFQDLASDSSITSQDTIILINQNKTFHLESLTNHHCGNDGQQPKAAPGENIYENIESCNNEISVISALDDYPLLPATTDATVANAANSETNNKCIPNEVVYENASEILSEVPNNNTSSKNLDSRLSVSSSEESKTDDDVEVESNNGTNDSNNKKSSSKLKQNILFYESIMQQQQQGKVASGEKSVATIQIQPPQQSSFSEVSPVLVSGSTIPLHLPLYTLVDSANRASPSSSSLSSSSSSSSSNPQQSQSATVTPTSLSSTTNSQQQLPSSLSPSSNSSSQPPQPQQQQHTEYIQYSVKGHPSKPQPPAASLTNLPYQQPQPQQAPRMNGPQPEGVIRPGQILYRYPYAFIQQPGANGVNTLRPVQYILQTANNANGGAQSLIYNPRFVAVNSQPNGNGPPVDDQHSPRPTTPILVQNPNGNDGSAPTGAIPVRRILVPQGTTVLAPRIMHLHPQHHKQNPPPYQYYVQQRQQLFAYQANAGGNATAGQQTTLAQFQQQTGTHPLGHTDFPNPSEIRRRDGLYAYPQVLTKPEEGKNSSHKEGEEKDELEEFVQQEQQRTERIKKRYSFTEDDDPTFGFARRPSVRGIRPKFGSTNEIIQQMTSTLPKQNPKIIMANPGGGGNHQAINTIFVEKPIQYGTLPKNAQFIQLNSAGGGHGPSHPQMISIVKQINDLQLNDGHKSQTLPRHLNQPKNAEPLSHEIVRIIDANLINGPGGNQTMSRDQLKLQLHKQLQMQQHRQQQQQKMMNVRLQAGDEQRDGSGRIVNHDSATLNGSKVETKSTQLVNSGDGPPPTAPKPSNPNDVVYYSLNV